MSHLSDAAAHLENALDHHAAGRQSAVKSSIQSAQRCVQRAIEQSNGHDPAINPTAAMGAQVSNGQSPRDYSPEAIRARDQRRAVDFAYQERLKQSGARR
jgi:hypothetical protein